MLSAFLSAIKFEQIKWLCTFFFFSNVLHQSIKKLKSIERRKVQETIKVSGLLVFRLLVNQQTKLRR